MKYIVKGSEPEQFLMWKRTIGQPWNAGRWGDLQNPEKGIVRRSLLEEQGYTCCYCNQKISETDSHIEHIKPQSKFPDNRFDYQNMLASCEGRGRKHCGHVRDKDSWYDALLFVSPLNPSCEQYFQFTSAGKIMPSYNSPSIHASQTTIDKLRLNIEFLDAMRKKAWDGILLDLDTFSNEELIRLRDGFRKKDNVGRFSPFCVAMEYLLNQYIAES